MTLFLVYSITLLVAVLLSKLAARSIVSISVLFLAVGFVTGPGVLGLYPLEVENPLVDVLTKTALFAVLFTDGMRIGFPELKSAWRLPGRALLLGMPIVLLITGVLARLLTGMSWTESFLIGAVLAPTDPVFAAAIVGSEDVPRRVRHLLNVESGLNDGLALPLVITLIAVIGAGRTDAPALIAELALGVAIGVGLPWAAWWLESRHFLAAHALYQPLFAVSVAFLLYGVTGVTDTNSFLAAFGGGVTIATLSDELREAFHRFGELIAELLKLAALLVFGALVSPRFFTEFGAGVYLFVALVFVAARPVAMAIALVGSRLGRPERLAIAWFGPKGFASVFYALLILRSGADEAVRIFHLIAVVIAVSMIAHSSTDVPIAHWFRDHTPDEGDRAGGIEDTSGPARPAGPADSGGGGANGG